MRLLLCLFLFYIYFQNGETLWRRGIVHYAINKKDYDYHSQDIIMSTLNKIQREICVKFFHTPMNYSANEDDKILYISNPEKRKDCPTDEYDFDETVVDMKIGYKCLNENDITRIIVDMLKASIRIQGRATSNDVVKDEKAPSSLLSLKDRNFINSNYQQECGEMMKPVPIARRNGPNSDLIAANDLYYQNKLWPFGVVFYFANPDAAFSPLYEELLKWMTVIEMSSCVVFHEVPNIAPKSYITFSSKEGEDMPALGVTQGEQILRLQSMINGTAGHTAHTLNMLFRILGVPMMSNRHDRDLYVSVHWNNIKKGMEHYFERTPDVAMLRGINGEVLPYDYDSVTHAPSNYLCQDCSLGQQTVTPLRDHLWQRTLNMGRRANLSKSDTEILNRLYSKECKNRPIS